MTSRPRGPGRAGHERTHLFVLVTHASRPLLPKRSGRYLHVCSKCLFRRSAHAFAAVYAVRPSLAKPCHAHMHALRSPQLTGLSSRSISPSCAQASYLQRCTFCMGRLETLSRCTWMLRACLTVTSVHDLMSSHDIMRGVRAVQGSSSDIRMSEIYPRDPNG